MLTITGSAALERILGTDMDPALKALLALRRDQLGEYGDAYLCFVIVEVDDPIATVTGALGFSPLLGIVDGTPFGEPGFAPPFEWVADHVGWLEAPIVLSDDGAGVVLIVQDRGGVDAELLALLRAYAVPAKDNPANMQRG